MKHGDQRAMTDVANRVRVFVQKNTCCVDTGIEVALVVVAGFVLDKCDHQADPAAAELERILTQLAGQVRDGKITMFLPKSASH